MTTVSDWSVCCAHCGFIEPSNLEDIEADETCQTSGVYVHKESCRAHECGLEHDLFMGLWNARIHMQMNDVLLRRINEELAQKMKPFIEKRLNDDSYFIKCEPSRFWG